MTPDQEQEIRSWADGDGTFPPSILGHREITRELLKALDLVRGSLASAVSADEDKVRFWHDAADERSAEIVRLMAALSASEKEKENAQHSVEALTCRADQAEERASTLNEQLATMDRISEGNRIDFDRVRARAEQAEERARIAEHQPKADSGTVAEMGRQLRTTLDRAIAAENENESLRKRLAELEGEIQEAMDDLDASEIPAARAHLSMITRKA